MFSSTATYFAVLAVLCDVYGNNPSVLKTQTLFKRNVATNGNAALTYKVRVEFGKGVHHYL